MSCEIISRITTILGHLEKAFDVPSTEDTQPNSTTVEKVSEIEQNFLFPRLPAPRVQFTPLLYGYDGTADFYFETQGVSGIVKISRFGEVIQYNSTIANIKSLVEQELEKILRGFKHPRASL